MTRLVVLLPCLALACALGCGGDDAAGDGGDGDGSVSAAEFCSEYGDICGYGEPPERFQEEQDCIDEYNGRSNSRQECMVEHLGLAEGDPDLHCPHATGQDPCS